jgi:hypothetical protein
MSSSYVRTEIINYIGTALPTENLIDLTAGFDNLNDLLEDNGLDSNDPWLGIQFIGGDEEAVDIAATNTSGQYREIGVISLHVVDIAMLGVGNTIINRAEAIRSAFRGKRIDDIVIGSIGTPNFEIGATLQFEGGYTSALVSIEYRRDFTL